MPQPRRRNMQYLGIFTSSYNRRTHTGGRVFVLVDITSVVCGFMVNNRYIKRDCIIDTI